MKIYLKRLKIIISSSLLVVLFFCTSINAQNILFQIDETEGPAVLYELYGEKIIMIDSIDSYDNGKYSLTKALSKMHTGFYRLSFNDNQWIDFINDHENIHIKADASDIPGSLDIIESKSNRLYYDFLKVNKAYSTKTEILHFILARYPRDDGYYEITENKLNEIQAEYLKFVKEISQTEPSSFIARYIKSAQLPLVNSKISIDKQLDYLKASALELVDFNDSGLIYSDLFTNKAIEYLTYYRNPNLSKELLEKEFIFAVDTLLNKAKFNLIVYQYITDYLVNGFKKFGFDNVIDHIVENYVIEDDLCLDEETEISIQKRIDQAKLLNIGSIIPNIVLPDRFGSEIDLAEIKSEKILILFYASWCDHCKKLLPELNKLYRNQNELEVYAISLDTDNGDWLDFVDSHNFDWINVSDLKGWDSKSASEFHIYATPTMFIVDQARRIIAKPLTLEELKKVL